MKDKTEHMMMEMINRIWISAVIENTWITDDAINTSDINTDDILSKLWNIEMII